MLYRVKAILSKVPKEPGGNRIRRADLNCPKGYSIPYDVMQMFGIRWDSLGSLLLFKELAGHRTGGDEKLLVHHLLNTYMYIYLS